MKTGAIVRIVIFSIVFIVLLAILLAGIGLNRFIVTNNTNSVTSWETSHSKVTEDHNEVTPISTVSSNIREIEIKWVVGTITVQSGDVEEITYEETAVEDSRLKLVANVSGDELEIEYCSEDAGFSISLFGMDLGTDIDVVKDLTITVPRNMTLNSLEIEAASAEIILTDLNIRDVSIDTASGKCEIAGCQIDELDVDTASGDVQFEGTLDVLDFDAASASFTAILSNTPRMIQVDSMSGAIDITLPPDAGFTVSMDSVSGNFSSEFETTIRNGNYICGHGNCIIEFDGMSGDITLRKGA